MAAPSGTQWGGVVGSGVLQGRIGIYITTSNSNTQTTATIQVWYWARAAVSDTSNEFKYGWASSPNVSLGAKSIQVTSNAGWAESNQVHIGTFSNTYNRGTSASTQYASASFSGLEYGGGSGSVSISFTVPALATYTLSYNANGGSGAPGNQTWQYGRAITISSTKPTRTGYTFKGWGTSASTTTVSYNPGSTFNGQRASNLTLYAIWTANSYTVSYNANGGSGAPSNQTWVYGATFTVSSTKPTRTGYTFKGWGTSASTTTVSYNPGSTIAGTSAKTMTLYAIWAINSYTVTYNANGGNFTAGGTTATQTKTYNSTVGTPRSDVTRAGYTFLGWATSSTATSATVTANTVITANVTFYAVWRLIVLTVTFDAGEGGLYSGTSRTTTKSVNYGSAVGDMPVPEKQNYNFLGYSTKQNSDIIDVTTATKITVNITFYAVWELAANCYVKQSGRYVPAMMYIKKEGEYKTGIIYARAEGQYKNGTM